MAAEKCGGNEVNSLPSEEEARGNNPDTPDAELDNLLDDALQDFDKPQGTSHQQLSSGTALSELQSCRSENSADNTSAAQCSSSSAGSKNAVQSQSPSDQEMESLFKSFMSGDISALDRHIEGLDAGASAAASAEEASFAETMQRTLGGLAQSTQDLQNSDISEDEMVRLMSSLGSGEGLPGFGEAGGDEDFMPLMHGMMKSLLSKDILYPSLKDISTQYPSWLETNREKLNSSEFERYERQSRLMATIVAEFELEQASDSDDVKRQRFERILDTMQQMQELGQPPKELVGDAPKEMEFDEDGMPKFPIGGIPNADQCIVM